jgi:predicted RNA-binding Zn ribbon-like protein
MSEIASENAAEKNLDFFFVGNHPALDLANTLIATKGFPLEFLPDFAAFSRWLLRAKLAGADQIKLLAPSLDGQEEEAFLAGLKGYRAKIKALIAEIGRGKPVPVSFIEATNQLLIGAGAVLQVEAKGPKSFARTWPLDWTKPVSVLGLVAEMGLQLVCDCDLTLVRECESPDCVLAFYDTTKNHKRRWCSMEVCGNRHKATLHRRKVQGATGQSNLRKSAS